MPKKEAVGRQGWWFAQVDEITLPCLHKSWSKGLNYHDPFKRHERKGLEKKIKEAVDAIIEGRQVVLTSWIGDLREVKRPLIAGAPTRKGRAMAAPKWRANASEYAVVAFPQRHNATPRKPFARNFRC